MESKFILAFIGLQLFCVISVNALDCYRCSGNENSNCYDPIEKNATSSACTPANVDYQCVKTEISFSGNDTVWVTRDCVPQTAADTFCATYETIIGTSGDVDACELCDEDLCNSSNTIVLFSASFVALSLLASKFL